MSGSAFYAPSSQPVTQYAAPTTGQTVTIAAGTEVLQIDPAGTIAALTVALPSAPVNGQRCIICCSQIITVLTITGTIVGTLTSFAVGGFAQFSYSTTAAKWMRAG